MKRSLQFLAVIRSIFRARKIIITCDQGVQYYRVGHVKQCIAIAAVLAFVAWASYSTGSYMAAQTTIHEKDRRIFEVSTLQQRTQSTMSLLREDLLKLRNEDGELSEYAEFVLSQYEQQQSTNNHGTGGNQKMKHDRVEFLETRLQEMANERLIILEEVRKRTKAHKARYYDIISSAGLDAQKLEAHYKREEARKHTVSTPQGGPYIPDMPAGLDASDPHLVLTMHELDELNMMASIVERLPLGIPMHGARITSGFGRRYDPFHGRLARHEGMDYVSHARTPQVRATAKGIVVFAGRKGAYGNMVEVNHGMGMSTRYAHLRSVNVRVGQNIPEGHVVGIQGSTGRSTGTHLHYEIRRFGVALNPARFLKAGHNFRQLERANNQQSSLR